MRETAEGIPCLVRYRTPSTRNREPLGVSVALSFSLETPPLNLSILPFFKAWFLGPVQACLWLGEFCAPE